MTDFLDRVPTPANQGWRELEIVEVGDSGLQIGDKFKAKVTFADLPIEEGTPFAKSNIATPIEVLDALDDSKVVTAYGISELKEYIDDEDNLKADKLNVLELDNTDPFTPTSDYHPATKTYVDYLTTNIFYYIDRSGL